MKKLVLLVGLLLVAVQFSAAQFSFGGGGHVGLSISSFPEGMKDYYGMGFGGGAHADANVLRFLTVRFNVDFHTFGFDDKKLKDQIIAANPGVSANELTMEGFRANVLGFTFNGIGKVPTKSVVTPYGLIGFGLHILTVSDPKVTYQGNDVTANLGIGKTESETKFGLNFGAGAEFAFGGMKTFIEFKYVLIFTKDNSTAHIPITIGVGI
ncbi:MAG: outer membrane beta-barrel protein [Bacteroidetes bacterium]|nr:outer membrane beta-barrel protein [Bacteroidota bacterium]